MSPLLQVEILYNIRVFFVKVKEKKPSQSSDTLFCKAPQMHYFNAVKQQSLGTVINVILGFFLVGI